MNFWKTKTFRAKPEFDRWIERNRGKAQFEVIFVNNGYGVIYRKLRRL